MTLRMWSDLSAEERAEAVDNARSVIASGEVRWHVVARMCGLGNSNGLRRTMDPRWRGIKNDAERKRMDASRRGVIAAVMNTPGHSPITLPRVRFLED